jgi:hypothetical protein
MREGTGTSAEARRFPARWGVASTVCVALSDLICSASSEAARASSALAAGVAPEGNIPTRVEKIVSNIVAGVAEGGDPALKSEAVVFTAHWDHLGVG